jgi:hypothetical protein
MRDPFRELANRELERAFSQPAFRPPRALKRPSIKQVEQQAGKPVSAVTYAPDGSKTYKFGGEPGTAETEPNPFDIEAAALRKRKA